MYPAGFIGPVGHSAQSWSRSIHSAWQKNADFEDTFTPFTTRPATPLRLGLVYLHRQSTSTTTVMVLGANKEMVFGRKM